MFQVLGPIFQVVGFIEPYPHRDKDYYIQSNFWKFYFIKTTFTLGELVFWWKCLDLNGFFWCSNSSLPPKYATWTWEDCAYLASRCAL